MIPAKIINSTSVKQNTELNTNEELKKHLEFFANRKIFVLRGVKYANLNRRLLNMN